MELTGYKKKACYIIPVDRDRGQYVFGDPSALGWARIIRDYPHCQAKKQQQEAQAQPPIRETLAERHDRLRVKELQRLIKEEQAADLAGSRSAEERGIVAGGDSRIVRLQREIAHYTR